MGNVSVYDDVGVDMTILDSNNEPRYEVTGGNDLMRIGRGKLFSHQWYPVDASWYEYGLGKGEYISRLILSVSVSHDTRVIESVCFNKDHQLDGLLQRWHINGKLKSQCEYKDGKLNSTCKEWDEEGSLTSETFFDKEARPSSCYLYHKNGEVSCVVNYDIDGEIDSLFLRYYENGQKMYDGLYSSGVPIGTHRSWYDNGNLEFEMLFEDEAIKEKKMYSYNGQLVYKRSSYPDHFLDERWNENGELTRRLILDLLEEPLYKKQVKGFELDTARITALEHYQPIKVKGGWLQLGMDGRARLFRADPTYISDEIEKLAQELEPALQIELESLGVDSGKYIRIKPEAKLAEDSLTRGNLQSLFQEKQRSNGLKLK